MAEVVGQRCPTPLCGFFWKKRFVPWSVTVHYRLGKPGAKDLWINFVNDKTGEKSHSVYFRNLPDGTKDGDHYKKRMRARFPRTLKNPESVILSASGDVPFSLFIFAIYVKTPWTKYRVPCFSWVAKDQGERLFVGGVPLLPKDVPRGLAALEAAELEGIRTDDNKTRSGNDRIYDYDVYNDLGQPDGPYKRATLGGSKERPYPRRLRTGRPLVGDGTVESRPVDPETEKEVPFWVPEDDAFVPEKLAGFLHRQQLNGQRAQTAIKQFGGPAAQFKDIASISKMYDPAPSGPGYPLPGVYENRPGAWKLDAEFGRQRIAGLNPCTIESIRALPKGSAITDLHVTGAYLEGGTLDERLKAGRIFMVDYTVVLPLLGKINSQKGLLPRFQYAPRCLFFSKNDGALVPVAIELLSPSDSGTASEVFTPKNSLTEWTVAKAIFGSVDFGVHELYSHFTRAHAATEPYLISTRRNFSTSHPLFRLLMPHFKDTLSINASARYSLIAAGGPIEQFFTPGVYKNDILTTLYSKAWRFKTEGLPADLIKRNMATPKKGADWRAGHVDLVLKDYPYAEDGLLVWKALHEWVITYVSLYYDGDSDLAGDNQLQAWWTEIKTKGHPDLVKYGIATEDEVWPELKTVDDLAYILVTIMWVTSGHHAAINFSQYEYAGYMPNLPTYIVQPMPKPDTITTDPDTLDESAFLRTVSIPAHAAATASLTNSLAVHGEGEEFLGDEIPHWLVDRQAKRALGDFRRDIIDIEKEIKRRNEDKSNPARSYPYTLLIPNLADGVGVPSATCRGIPNSISI